MASWAVWNINSASSFTSSRQGPVQSLPEFPEDFDNGHKDQCVGDCIVACNLHHYCR